MVAAPLDGVIAEFLVKPNQNVKQGDVLVRFDATSIKAQADVAERSLQVAEAELRAKGLSEDEVQRLAPHKVIPGNRPSNTLVLERVSPGRLGALIALYEHKVFVQSAIWGTNAFDQWGVEHGKQLAATVAADIAEGTASAGHDSSTKSLLDWYLKHR